MESHGSGLLAKLALMAGLGLLLALAGCGSSTSATNADPVITMFSTNPSFGTMNWYLNGFYEGTTTTYWPSGAPACGAATSPSVVTASVSPGSTVMTASCASCNQSFSPGLINAASNNCYRIWY
jgi:hypothetical protein